MGANLDLEDIYKRERKNALVRKTGKGTYTSPIYEIWERRKKDDEARAEQESISAELRKEQEKLVADAAKKESERSLIDKGAGFVKDTVVSMYQAGRDTVAGGANMVQGALAGNQVNKNSDIAKENNREWNAYMQTLQDGDWEKPEVKEKLKEFSYKQKLLDGTATEADKPKDAGALTVGADGIVVMEKGDNEKYKKYKNAVVDEQTKKDVNELAAIDRTKLAAQAGETWLNVATLGMGAAAVQGGKIAAKTGGYAVVDGIVTKLTGQGVKGLASNAAKDAMIGGAFGATATMKNAEADTGLDDYTKNILIGASIGAAAPVVLRTGGRLVKKSDKVAGQAFSGAARGKTENEVIQRTLQQIGDEGIVGTLDKLVSRQLRKGVYAASDKMNDTKWGSKVISSKDAFMQKWVSSAHPLYKTFKRADFEGTGTGTYLAAREAIGSANRGLSYAGDFIEGNENYRKLTASLAARSEAAKDYVSVPAAFDKYAKARSEADLVAAGKKVFSQKKLDDIDKTLKEFADSGFDQEYDTMVKVYSDLNDARLEHGIISKELHESYANDGFDYVRQQRELPDWMMDKKAPKSSGSAMSITSTELDKSRNKYASQELLSPLDTLVKSTQVAFVEGYRNKSAKTIYNLLDEVGEAKLLRSTDIVREKQALLRELGATRPIANKLARTLKRDEKQLKKLQKEMDKIWADYERRIDPVTGTNRTDTNIKANTPPVHFTKKQIADNKRVQRQLIEEDAKAIYEQAHATRDLLGEVRGGSKTKNAGWGISSWDGYAAADIPKSAKNKRGLPLDERASILGFDDTDEFVDALKKSAADPGRKLTMADARYQAEEAYAGGTGTFQPDWDSVSRDLDNMAATEGNSVELWKGAASLSNETIERLRTPKGKPRSLGKFVEALALEDPVQFKRLRTMFEKRDDRYSALFDQIEASSRELQDLYAYRKGLWSNAQGLHTSVDKGNKTTMSFLDDGVENIVEIDPAIASGVHDWDRQAQNGLIETMRFANNVFKYGTTAANVGFALPNFVADQVGSAINSKAVLATHNPSNFVHGFFMALGKPLNAEDARALAEFRAGNKGYLNVNQYTRKDSADKISRKIIGNQTNAGTKIYTRIKHPKQAARALIDASESAIGLTENMTRIQNFRGTKRAAQGKGLTGKLYKGTASEFDATRLANQAARENSIDFLEMGSYGRMVNNFIPYFNASVQGTRTIFRNMAEKPVSVTAKSAALIGMPLAASTIWNTGTKERKAIYDTIPEYVKDTNFVVISPSAKWNEQKRRWEGVFLMKKPPGVKEFSEPIRKFIEYKADDPNSNLMDYLADNKGSIAKDFTSSMSPIDFSDPNKLLSSMTPQILKPTAEAIINRNFFQGENIVPDYMSDLEVKDQKYSQYSQLTTHLAAMMNTSPLKVDHWIKGTFGEVGTNAQYVIDRTMGAPDEAVGGRSLTETVVRRFYGPPGKADTDAFYEIYNPTKSARVRTSEKVTELVKMGRINEAKRRAEEYNATIKDKFAPFMEKYGDSPTYGDKWDESIDSLVIPTSDQAFKARRRQK